MKPKTGLAIVSSAILCLSFPLSALASSMLSENGMPNELKCQASHNCVGGYMSDWSQWRGGTPVKFPGLESAVPWKNLDWAAMAFAGIAQSQHISSAWPDPPLTGKNGYNLPTYGGISPTKNILGETQWTGTTTSQSADWSGHIFNADHDTDTKWLPQLGTLMAGKPLLLSVGGWSYTQRFRDMAAADNYSSDGKEMANFLADIDKLAGQPWFSGIDIDWEYPTIGHNQKQYWKVIPQEGPYYGALLNKVGQKMINLSNANGKPYYLSIALPCYDSEIEAMFKNTPNLADIINKNVSYITLMAYDINGEFNLHNPIFKANAYSMTDPVMINKVINYLINQGVNPDKIMLGLPNYVREMIVKESKNSGYEQPLLKDGVETYTADKSYIDPANPEPYPGVGGMVDNTGIYYYGCLVNAMYNPSEPDNCSVEDHQYPDMRDTGGEKLPKGIKYVNQFEKDGVAWAIGTKGSVNSLTKNGPGEPFNGYPVFSFDTPAVVKYKIDNFVKKYHLAGVSFWELYGDAYKFGSDCSDRSANKYSNICAAYNDLKAK